MAQSDISSLKMDLIIDDRASSSSSSETATIVLTASSYMDNEFNNAEGDASSVGSGGSRSEERRRKREVWRRQHDDQLRVDGSFPRRRSSGQDGGGVAGGMMDGSRSSKEAVSARVVQHLGTKSTAKPHTLPPAVSDDVRVRSNLLRTLGISNGTGSSGKGGGGGGSAQQGVAGGGGNKGGAGGGNPGGGIIGGVLQGGGGVGGAGAGAGAGGGGGAGEVSSSMPGGGGGGGIEPLHQGKNAAVASAVVVVASGRSLLSNVRFKEELKYDSDDDADPYVPTSYNRFFGGRQRFRSRSYENKPPNNGGRTTTTTTNTTNGAPIRRRRLGFADEVQVVPIPMRSEYSNRIKERMYSGRVELSENAQRNVVEFEAEGWDATTVLDDENQFYKCPLTGELIHPVHLAYFNKGAGGEANDDHR